MNQSPDTTEPPVRRQYTVAMLAQLTGVGAWRVRNWNRRGWIVAQREKHRLLYFDFTELSVARRIAELLRTGATTRQIRESLAEFQERIGKPARPLAEMSVVADGAQLLFREGDSLIDPSGQRRFDFLSPEDPPAEDEAEPIATVVPPEIFLAGRSGVAQFAPDQLVQAAADLEEQGDLKSAAEMLRAAMSAGGTKAPLSFQLADLLYRLGDLSAARERLYVALEMDEEFVEARANLGCILAELGEHELAIAALQGAVSYHPEYADAHYHLARALDDAQRREEAQEHWRQFLDLAPDSPWADEAQRRLKL